MNDLEKNMYETLSRLKGDFGAVSVKAEFEAEGTRHDEMLRLLDVSRKAGLKVGLKIGGCEAVRDLLESKQFGVDFIIAPMVETPYALSKFILAKNKVYGKSDAQSTDFLFNIETRVTFENASQMAKLAQGDDGLQGGVFGRVDYVGSLGLGRDAINTDRITDDTIAMATVLKSNGLDLVVGGAVDSVSVPHLRRMREVHLTRFETRKVIFGADALDAEIVRGLELTVGFELNWLQNKRNYYQQAASEDDTRIAMLEARWNNFNK